jgi:hypothetical protein
MKVGGGKGKEGKIEGISIGWRPKYGGLGIGRHQSLHDYEGDQKEEGGTKS